MEPDEKACPFCAEMIKAAAIKCKHCGEMLDADEDDDAEWVAVEDEQKPEAMFRWTGKVWRCVEHERAICVTCRKRLRPPVPKTKAEANTWPVGFLYPTDGDLGAGYTGTMGQRQKLSSVADRSTGTLACPRCGSTSFTAKRSNTGKAVGFATLGVGGLIAPKSQVKCVACGLKFKRG